MPILGFLGFPPFALECFVMAEFARALRDRVSAGTWKLIVLLGFAFMLAMCRLMDLRTVASFKMYN